MTYTILGISPKKENIYETRKIWINSHPIELENDSLYPYSGSQKLDETKAAAMKSCDRQKNNEPVKGQTEWAGVTGQLRGQDRQAGKCNQ